MYYDRLYKSLYIGIATSDYNSTTCWKTQSYCTLAKVQQVFDKYKQYRNKFIRNLKATAPFSFLDFFSFFVFDRQMFLFSFKLCRKNSLTLYAMQVKSGQFSDYLFLFFFFASFVFFSFLWFFLSFLFFLSFFSFFSFTKLCT